MRSIVFGLLFLLFVGVAEGRAECDALPIGETASAYADALLGRMSSLGVRDIGLAETEGNRGHYLVLGADFSLFLTSKGGLLSEIGFVLSEPLNAVETERLMTAVGYTLAHYSGEDERAIRARLDADLVKRDLGSWADRAGSFIVVFTKTHDGLVVKLGKLAC